MNHIIIFDLEASCWPSVHNQTRTEAIEAARADSEIIEIGAVKCDPITFEISSTFQSFIKPVKHPILSDFCKELTHITQENVDGGEPFRKAAKSFFTWANSPNAYLGWGKYDYAELKKNCVEHSLECFSAERYINAKDLLVLYTGKKGVGLAKQSRMMNIPWTGTQHRALTDAEQTAKIFQTAVKPNLENYHRYL